MPAIGRNDLSACTHRRRVDGVSRNALVLAMTRSPLARQMAAGAIVVALGPVMAQAQRGLPFGTAAAPVLLRRRSHSATGSSSPRTGAPRRAIPPKATSTRPAESRRAQGWGVDPARRSRASSAKYGVAGGCDWGSVARTSSGRTIEPTTRPTPEPVHAAVRPGDDCESDGKGTCRHRGPREPGASLASSRRRFGCTSGRRFEGRDERDEVRYSEEWYLQPTR